MEVLSRSLGTARAGRGLMAAPRPPPWLKPLRPARQAGGRPEAQRQGLFRDPRPERPGVQQRLGRPVQRRQDERGRTDPARGAHRHQRRRAAQPHARPVGPDGQAGRAQGRPATGVITATLEFADQDFRYRSASSRAARPSWSASNLDKPLPAALEGKAGFNLEVLPSAYFRKTFLADGKPGGFPLYPSGPMAPRRPRRAGRAPAPGHRRPLRAGPGRPDAADHDHQRRRRAGVAL
jgi:hypothetical protein